jgi:hypothetical protein
MQGVVSDSETVVPSSLEHYKSLVDVASMAQMMRLKPKNEFALDAEHETQRSAVTLKRVLVIEEGWAMKSTSMSRPRRKILPVGITDSCICMFGYSERCSAAALAVVDYGL